MMTARGKKTSVAAIFGCAFALLIIGADAGAKEEKVPTITLPEKPAAVLPLPLPDSCHSQGLALDDNFLYLSCVDLKNKKGLVYRIARPGLESPNAGGQLNYQKLDLTIGSQYHPSGLDLNGPCLWVAMSEYHPAPANSTIICVDRESFQPVKEKRFPLADHIGALAAGKNWLMAANWDAGYFYLLDYSGKLLVKGENPTGTAFQDCKYLEGDLVLCSGPAGRISGKGYTDLIRLSDLKPESWKLNLLN